MTVCIVGEVIPWRSDQLNVPGANPAATTSVPEKFKVPKEAELMLRKVEKPEKVPGDNARGRRRGLRPVGRYNCARRPIADAEKEKAARLDRFEKEEKSSGFAAVFQPSRFVDVKVAEASGMDSKLTAPNDAGATVPIEIMRQTAIACIFGCTSARLGPVNDTEEHDEVPE